MQSTITSTGRAFMLLAEILEDRHSSDNADSTDPTSVLECEPEDMIDDYDPVDTEPYPPQAHANARLPRALAYCEALCTFDD